MPNLVKAMANDNLASPGKPSEKPSKKASQPPRNKPATEVAKGKTKLATPKTPPAPEKDTVKETKKPTPPPVSKKAEMDDATEILSPKDRPTEISTDNDDRKEKKSFLNLRKAKWPFGAREGMEEEEEEKPSVSAPVPEPEPEPKRFLNLWLLRSLVPRPSKRSTKIPIPANGKSFLGFTDEKLVPQLMSLSFANRVEKYLAFQAASLHDGESDLLDSFNWLDFVEPWDGRLKKLKPHQKMTSTLC